MFLKIQFWTGGHSSPSPQFLALTMPRSLEAMAQYYQEQVPQAPDLAYAAVLLRSANAIINNSEESGQISKKDPAAVALASRKGEAKAKKSTPKQRQPKAPTRR